ncbi:hypothetical protein NL108_002293 [Boleophthalmus pectinirostris]|uniref:coiled-coil domain-containing protein 177 n=1 Tax=Boleophthalmus pectinirostris TaxID=150288 RepID=UPI00242CBDCD|nr:coiled-coil domain-containing protein 177 [Boleophthalmus pectinirostris]KAJ0066706.1 hypothetical protein NL108_002293 [Boleophthalmus pectinirostris]
MAQVRSTSPVLHLDLNNFESVEAQRSRFVLTSPRSLESCARLGIKPVELLIKSLNQLKTERRDVPFEVVKVMHEMYEKERKKLLRMCKAERERLIQGSTENKRPRDQKAPEFGPGISRTSTRTQSKKDEPYERPVTYADLCFKRKSMSSNKEPDRSTLCSISLGDLRQSPACERKLERIATAINKEMNVTVSEEDRKIAALMLARHEEEQIRLEQSYNEEQERKEARHKEQAEKMEEERRRLKKLKMGMKRWNEELELRRRIRNKLEKEKSTQLEQEALLHEDRWRRLKEEVEVQRKEKLMATVKEAEERKRNQERLLRGKEEVDRKVLERERMVSVEREQRAKMNKALQEMKERRRLQEENRQELLRHVFTKQRIEQEEEEVEEQRRREMERKMEICSKKHAEVVDAHLREIKERVAQEEAQIHRAKLRASLQKTEQLMHKKVLYEVSQRRMEKATQHAMELNKSRAIQVKQRNRLREMYHQQMRERLQAEDEEVRKLKESCVVMKEWKIERLRRQREQIQEEAQRLARASFHLRDRVRQHINNNNFDQMDKEAQLNAKGHVKLI